MRDRMERLVVLPFSIGCVSHSSVAIRGSNQTNKTKSSSNSALTRRQASEESSPVVVKMKNSWGFLAIPKPNIPNGIQRLVKGLKSFSQLFVYKEEMEEMEEREMEMEIGFPTDVKHVTHIGWDGTTTTTSTTTADPVKGSSWENVTAPPEILYFPHSVTLRQFEIAMAAQADAPSLYLTTSQFT